MDVQSALAFETARGGESGLKMARPRVLVVDDDRAIREALALALRSEGYEVDTVPDGRAAMDAIAQAPPGLIILDLLMPEMSGIDVLDQLQAHPRFRSIPAVLMTAAGNAGNPHHSPTFIKPINLESLLHLVERY